jgi:Ni,Fe-hydrogenase I small subunit
MWSCLGDISKQVPWHVNGVVGLISTEDWKDILSASLKREGRIAQGIDGGFVMLGQRTSKMKVQEMCDLIELIYAFGAGYGVVWSEPIPAEYQEFSEAQK